ncbi:MAG TPA: HD domain-containing protein [Chloroflexota bacterium]|nr:HD domain-containing protein [Chloroflexota bacterium]
MPANNNKTKKPWREAVEEVMRHATEAEALARFGKRKPAFNYRWEHVTAVVTLANKLAELTGADGDVVEAAAWLHDVRKEAKEKHPLEGAKFARKFLPKTDFPPEKVEAVAQAIEAHMGLWLDKPLTNLEAQVLWDADKLAKIGLTAVFHFTGNVLAKGKPTTTADLITMGNNAAWQSKTVASMHTEPARRAAAARFQAYNQLWSSLEGELVGDDLCEP